jgi:hypothetical protein
MQTIRIEENERTINHLEALIQAVKDGDSVVMQTEVDMIEQISPNQFKAFQASPTLRTTFIWRRPDRYLPEGFEWATREDYIENLKSKHEDVDDN